VRVNSINLQGGSQYYFTITFAMRAVMLIPNRLPEYQEPLLPQDAAIVAGESGAAGLAGLCKVAANADLRTTVGMGPTSRVLVINTEGATDPEIYERIVSTSCGEGKQ
jgi:threonine dehydratase